MIPKECKRLAEVDFPIAEVSRHSDPAFFLSAVSYTTRVTAALKEIGKLVDLDVVMREG
jgi:hypothetical protein